MFTERAPFPDLTNADVISEVGVHDRRPSRPLVPVDVRQGRCDAVCGATGRLTTLAVNKVHSMGEVDDHTCRRLPENSIETYVRMGY